MVLRTADEVRAVLRENPYAKRSGMENSPAISRIAANVRFGDYLRTVGLLRARVSEFNCAYRIRGRLATESTTSRSIFCVGSPRREGM